MFEPPEPTRAPIGATVRVRFTVAYDGSGYRGFAANRDVVTVGGTLTAALERVLGVRVELTCAGRTDAGVHAWGQVVSFDAPAEGLDVDQLARAVTKLCSPSIVVRDAATVPDDFDARFSATSRTYRYTVLNRPVPDPFLAATSWHVERPLDLHLLRLACDQLIGEHDFSSFCRAPKREPGEPPASLVRRVRRARWDDLGDGVLRFEIEANAFCHQMVRSLVGTLVEVGLGRLTPGELGRVLRAHDRHAAGQLAPPHGLCLHQVDY
ncbi:MAG TPA: tRNA pseudouridine(38-40) synthase TruA [Acidimicrobiales bacterium]|nr:tRNA pseudouridine(38-40) synthase TruA [Acidimicrobiales bacterium]